MAIRENPRPQCTFPFIRQLEGQTIAFNQIGFDCFRKLRAQKDEEDHPEYIEQFIDPNQISRMRQQQQNA